MQAWAVIMAFYQLTMFYKSVRSEQLAIQAATKKVELLAGRHWRVLSPGEQVCAIGFSTDKSREHIRDEFQELGTDTFSFLLVEVADMPFGWLTGDKWQWIANQLRK